MQTLVRKLHKAQNTTATLISSSAAQALDLTREVAALDCVAEEQI